MGLGSFKLVETGGASRDKEGRNLTRCRQRPTGTASSRTVRSAELTRRLSRQKAGLDESRIARVSEALLKIAQALPSASARYVDKTSLSHS